MSKNIKIIICVILVLIFVCAFAACAKKPVDNNNGNNGNGPDEEPIDPITGKPIISFNSNGGSMINGISVTVGSVVTAPRAPTRSGFVFAGWYKDNKLTSPYTFNVMPDKSITLYAKWTIASNDNVNIDSAEGLLGIANNLSGRYSLISDIDLGGAEWLPIGIGAGKEAFSGILDGNGFSISNFKITSVEKDNKYIGLFGYLTGNVDELVLKNFTINVKVSNDTYVGGIAGYVEKLSSNTYGIISNSEVSGTIKVVNSSSVRPLYTGGIAGKSTGGVIEGCKADMEMELSGNNLYCGVILGDNSGGGVVESCTASGNVSGSYYAKYSITSAMFSAMDINRAFKVYAGGLLGYNGGSVINCNAASGVEAAVTFDYSYGRINGKLLFKAATMAYAGGLIGCSIGNVSGSSATGSVTAKTDNSLSFTFIAERTLTADEIKEGIDLEDEMKYKDKVALSGSAFAGGLIGENGGDFDGFTASELTNCYSTGKVFADNKIYFAVDTIEPAIQLDCFNYAYAGGLIGFARNSSIVSKSYSTADCKSTASSDFDDCNYNEAFNEYCIYSGGFIGYNCGEISVCYATGDSESAMLQDYMYRGDKEKKNKKYSYKAFAGGFAGLNKSKIEECYAIGNSAASSYGDISANKDGTLSRTDGYNQYFAYAGGFIGQNNEAILNNSFATGNASAKTGLCTVTNGVLTEVYDSLARNKYDSYAGSFAGEKYSDKSVCSKDFSVPSVQTLFLSANTVPSDKYSTIGNVNKTLAELQKGSELATYLSWNRENWNFSLTHSNGYPTLI